MTGIDAMVHATEAMTSRIKKNQLSDMFGREALRLLGDNLLKAAGSESKNGKVRENMLLGSMYAGVAFANAPVGAVHALAYPLGTLFHVPHGLSISLVLPAVLRFNMKRSDLAMNTYAEVATILYPGEFTERSSVKDRAEFLPAAFEELARTLDLSTKLRDVGVREDDLDRLAQDAMKQTRLLPNNPADVTKSDAISIFRAVL